MYKWIQTLSNFTLTLIIVNLLNYEYTCKFNQLKFIDYILLAFVALAIVSSIILFRRPKHSNNSFFEKNDAIVDSTLNRKVLEVWFMTMAPLLAITPDTNLKKWILCFIFIVIFRLIKDQTLFLYNALFPIFGYKYFEIEIEKNKFTCITKLNKNELNTYIEKFEEYFYVAENVIYVPKDKKKTINKEL